jgi:hypothetical protein
MKQKFLSKDWIEQSLQQLMDNGIISAGTGDNEITEINEAIISLTNQTDDKEFMFGYLNCAVPID